MSQLREQLEAARELYLAQRYPGDLALQVIPVRRKWWSRFAGTAVAGLAAAIIAAILLHQAIMSPTPPQRATVPVTRAKRPMFVVLPGLPQAPKSMTLAPALGDQPVFLPALPTFPSLLETLSDRSEAIETVDENSTALEAS